MLSLIMWPISTQQDNSANNFQTILFTSTGCSSIAKCPASLMMWKQSSGMPSSDFSFLQYSKVLCITVTTDQSGSETVCWQTLPCIHQPLVPDFLAHCHTVILSQCHTVTMSYCHNVILSHCHTVTLSYCHTVTLSYAHTVTLSHHNYTNIAH